MIRVIGFSATGFYSSAIIYAVFAVFSWFAPSVMVVLGLKVTMFLGAVSYPVLVASFFYLNDYLYYSASALLGLGAAILWSAQASYRWKCRLRGLNHAVLFHMP